MDFINCTLVFDQTAPLYGRAVVLIGECKWTSKINPDAILKELKEKVDRLKWLDHRDIRYLLFSKYQCAVPPGLKIITPEDVTSPATR